MTKPGGWNHTPETREKIRATMSDPAKRAEHSKITKARMADPAVRQRIKDGMRAASGQMEELRTLRSAWRAARPAVRARFLAELHALICTAPDPTPFDPTEAP